MKKAFLILLTATLLVSCFDNEVEPRFQLEFLPVENRILPDTLKFGQIDTLKIKYSLPNECYSFYDLYYQAKDTARTVAVRAAFQLDTQCLGDAVEKELEFYVNVSQREDYLFRFFKGYDQNGDSTFEDIVVPVKEF